MWVRVDDHVPEHPKFLKAGPIAAWLWVCGNCHCNKYLTDGFIDEAAVRGLGQVPNARRHAATLVLVGLWERVAGGYQVHDYHQHNPWAEQVKAKREADKLRKRLQAEATDGTPPPKVPVIEKPAIPLPATLRADSDAIPVRLPRDSAPIPLRSRDRDPIPSPPIPSPPEERVLTRTDGATDERWTAFLDAYPPQRREGGYMTQQGFIQACGAIGFSELMVRLELQKQSEDWKKGMVPRTGNYFERQLWRQEPPAAVDATSELVKAAQAHMAKTAAEKQARRG